MIPRWPEIKATFVAWRQLEWELSSVERKHVKLIGRVWLHRSKPHVFRQFVWISGTPVKRFTRPVHPLRNDDLSHYSHHRHDFDYIFATIYIAVVLETVGGYKLLHYQ